MDIISLLIGVGAVVGWYYSGRNWIINDIICVCLIITMIKLLKFTSLQIAVITFLIIITVEMAFVLAIHFGLGTSYNNLLINSINAPFEFQFPTINPVLLQKCAWLPITAVAYPGMLLSYLRRFDSSRNTHVYLIIGVVIFVIGSFIW